MSEFASLLAKMKGDLLSGGYIFDDPRESLRPPFASTSKTIRDMKNELGSFPYAVESFYKFVGGVDFCGSTNCFEELDYPDPLQLSPFDYYERCFKEFLSSDEEREWWVEGWGGFALLISADYYHKENVSGGPEYSVKIPATSDDPLIEFSPWDRSFLDYLALVLKYAGFPGYLTEKLELPPYYSDASILETSQNLSLRFSELAQEYRESGR